MTRFPSQSIRPAAVLFLSVAAAAPAAAQSSSQPRLEISANVAVQSSARTFKESEGFPSNGGETATVTVDHKAKVAPGFDAGAAVRIASRLWVGVHYAVANVKAAASISASIPHPLLFNAPRTVEGSIGGVTHDEQQVHVDLMYALPLRAVEIKAMAGPTFFGLKQDFVTGVSVHETYPFDTATFASAATKQVSKSSVGFNAGLDVARALTAQVAIGGLIRYSRADVKFDDAAIGAHTVTAGGVEGAVGVRLRF